MIIALLLSILPPSFAVKAEDDSTVTRGDYIYSLSADPDTGAVPAGFGTPESNGRIWTDKSVSVNNKHFDVDLKVLAVKVADCSYTEADIAFSVYPEYGTGIDLNAPEAAEQLYSAVKNRSVSQSSAVSDGKGKAVFGECELGAYLIYSSDETFSPFLALVPLVTEDGINFNLTAEPKIDIPEEETTDPTEEETTKKDDGTETTTDKSSTNKKEPGEKLPKTGMLQLPIPILGFLGAMMFSGGLILYAKGKKEEN